MAFLARAADKSPKIVKRVLFRPHRRRLHDAGTVRTSV